MLRSAAAILVRARWFVLAAWVVTAGVLALTVRAPDPRINEPTGYLPDWLPSQRAIQAISQAFPRSGGLSQAVVVLERPDDPATPQVERLTPADLNALDAIATRINDPAASPFGRLTDVKDLQVLSPTRQPFLRGALVSPAQPGKGQAALIFVQVPANFITLRASDVVNHIQSIVDTAPLPPGLSVAVTGSASFGRDYAAASVASERRTQWVTVLAVMTILLLVYRAPLAAAVPLVAIGLAAIVATCVLALASHLGLRAGPAERIFVYVLLYGAGVDYALFFIARSREFLAIGRSPREAAAEGWAATIPAIVASAGTTISGLLMLTLAQFRIFRQVGPAVAIALLVALLAAITLTPAMVALLGRWIYWPNRRLTPASQRRIWPAIANFVTRHPVITLLLAAALLAPPAIRGSRLTWVYDTLADLKPTYASIRGADIIKRHWPIGELAPATVLIQAKQATNLNELTAISRQLTEELLNVPGVSEVRSLSAPVGAAPATAPALAARLAATSFYASPDAQAMRMTVVIDQPAFSNAAMATLDRVRQTIGNTLARTPLAGSSVYLAGATVEMADIRALTQQDFYRVAVAALAIITLIAILLLRDAILAVFLVASTVLGYLTTLGLTYWVFTGLLGAAGIDWKVEVFLFVVMVAVGQDYNIFLTARLAQEGLRQPPRQAARSAIVATGGIISSCGLIMAATLGSLLAGDLTLLQQLGFAFAAGMLIDTFAVRPLLIPAFTVLTRRTGRSFGARP